MQIDTESSKQTVAVGGPNAGARRWLVPGGVGVLLLILFLQLAFSTSRNSITWDEDDHIYAGYMSWKHGDFGLNPEHPPLVKLLGTLPLLNMRLTMPAQQNRFFKTEAFLNGKDFLFKNDPNTDVIARAPGGFSADSAAGPVRVSCRTRDVWHRRRIHRARIGSLRPEPARAWGCFGDGRRTDLLHVWRDLCVLPLREITVGRADAASWSARRPGIGGEAYGHPDLPHADPAIGGGVGSQHKFERRKQKEIRASTRSRAPGDQRDRGHHSVGILRIPLPGASRRNAVESTSSRFHARPIATARSEGAGLSRALEVAAGILHLRT